MFVVFPLDLNDTVGFEADLFSTESSILFCSLESATFLSKSN